MSLNPSPKKNQNQSTRSQKTQSDHQLLHFSRLRRTLHGVPRDHHYLDMVRVRIFMILVVALANALPRLGRRQKTRPQTSAMNPPAPHKAPESSSVVLGSVGLFGGILTHLVLGSFYCVPNMASYMRPELQFFKGSGSGKPDALYSMPLTLATSSVFMPVGAWLATEVSPSLAALAGGLVVALSCFLSSYATKCWQFILSQGVLFGVGHALAYTSPMVSGWRVFPTRRGLVSGTILTGFGSAAFVWNPIITLLMNPENLPPPFPDFVSARLASTLRTLAASFCATSFLGAALVAISSAAVPKGATARTKPTATGQVERSSTSKALSSPHFWSAWALCTLSASAALNVAALWKGFASRAGAGALRTDDRALALAGSLSALGNGFGRFFFATISDTYGLGPTYLLLLRLEVFSMLALGPAALSGSPPLFAATLGVVFFCLGGIFSLSPPLASALFGPIDGPKVYGFIFSAFPFASISGQILSQLILDRVGWHTVIQIFTVLGATAFFPLHTLWPRLQHKAFPAK